MKTATFSCGTVMTYKGKVPYTHALLVKSHDGKLAYRGYSKSREAAERAAISHGRAYYHMCEDKTNRATHEVVELV